MNSIRCDHLWKSLKLTLLGLAVSLFAPSALDWLSASDTHIRSDVSRGAGRATASLQLNVSTDLQAAVQENEPFTIQSLAERIRAIHPLLIAAGQLLAVIGICLVFTDNRELELYFRIEFHPPKVDILN